MTVAADHVARLASHYGAADGRLTIALLNAGWPTRTARLSLDSRSWVVKDWPGFEPARRKRVLADQRVLFDWLAGAGAPVPALLPQSAGADWLEFRDEPGSPRLAGSRDLARMASAATALAGLHALPAPGFLPAWREDLWAHFSSPEPAPAGGAASSPVLVHGDFHPGNLLWSGARCCVFDWDHACVGPRGFDVAHFRVDMVLLSGEELADAFLSAYERTAGPVDDIVFWDLHRAAGAALHFPQWIPNMRPVGFPIDIPVMRARLERFIARRSREAGATGYRAP